MKMTVCVGSPLLQYQNRDKVIESWKSGKSGNQGKSGKSGQYACKINLREFTKYI